MSIHTYRAASLQEALDLVRKDLGPDASVLHTREVNEGMWRWLVGGREIEVVASNTIEAPSRLPPHLLPGSERSAPSIARQSHVPPGREPETPVDRPAARRARRPRSPERPPLDAPLGAVPPADAIDYRERFRRELKRGQSESGE